MRHSKDTGSHALRGSGRRKKARSPEKGPGPLKRLGQRLRGRLRPRLPDKKYILITAAALAALLVIILSAVSISSDKSDYKHYMTQAADCYGREDYDGALSLLRKAAAIEPKDECYLMTADCYEAQGNISKAVEALQKIKSSERSILRRIAELEQKRSAMMAVEKIAIGELKLSPEEKIIVLDSMSLNNMDLETLKSFRFAEKLSLRDNDISCAEALTALTGLSSLDLSGNSISDISALSSLQGLRNLRLDGNPIEDTEPLKQLKNLRSLSLRGLGLKDWQLRELSEALPGCAVFAGEDALSPALITLGGVSFTSDITELDLSGRELSDISALSFCRSLRKLNLSYNSISDLTPIMNNPSLRFLDVSHNLISDLRPLMGMLSLQSVIAEDNRIGSTAALSALKALVELRLRDNPIGDFSGLRGLPALQRLSLQNTGLKDESLTELYELPSLSYLNIEENPGLSGEAVEMLKIELGQVLVDHSRLLYSVKIAGESVKGSATELNLSGRGISDISELGKLSCLESLDLSDNAISNIYIFQLTDSRESLKYLDLSGNSIEDITPIASLQNLESLDLSGNNISSVMPLMRLYKLRMLKIGGNQLDEEQLQSLRESLTGCEIVLD